MRMRKRAIGYRVIFPCWFLVGIMSNLHAQQADTLSIMRDFVNISNGYKRVPMFLDLVMKNSTNFIAAPEDTMSAKGQFYLTHTNSYVHFGDFEQVVNDSVAVLVSHKLQQIIVYTDAAPVVKRMKSMMGIQLPDSAVRDFAGRYLSSTKKIPGESSVIELRSRDVLPGTAIPGEAIELRYDEKKKTPQQVITCRRDMIPLDSMQYLQLKKEGGVALEASLLKLEDGYFLVKEQVTTYMYKQLDLLSAVKVPVLVSDRVTYTNNTGYVPVKKYESYRLIIND